MPVSKNGVPILKSRAVRAKEWLLDAADALLTRRDPMTPPRSLQFVGGGDFAKIGNSYLHLFVDECGLQPDDRVLDVGCGVGRMAVPLTRYLSQDGAYHGFDIVKPGIDWCQRAITPRFPSFRFEWAPVFNGTYNPQGTMRACDYRFPYPDESFDFVFLTAVFTQMLPADHERYLSEIVRVLRPGKRCLATYFLLNEEARRLVSSGASSLNFRVALDGCMTISATAPESAVAYDEAGVLDLWGREGMCVIPPVRYGSWCGRRDFLRYQDLIVAEKR